MENLTFNETEVFERLVEQGMVDGVNNQDAYNEMVDEFLEDMLRIGELNDDQNIDLHKENLRARWGEYEARISEDSF